MRSLCESPTENPSSFTTVSLMRAGVHGDAPQPRVLLADILARRRQDGIGRGKHRGWCIDPGGRASDSRAGAERAKAGAERKWYLGH
jgi:hypothetical protein